MNIFLWILQILLALWNIIGGTYMSMNYQNLATSSALGVFPGYFWIGLGILQVIFSLCLVSSFIKGVSKKIVPISALCLAVLSLAGIGLYAMYSGFPGMLWGVVPALLLVFVAYERAKKS